MTGTFLYAGCYTNESPEGIRIYDASDPQGLLVERSAVQGIDHPSFLAAHPNGRVLYAVSETTSFQGSEGGGLVAFGIDPTDGSLRRLDQASSQGAGPCHVSVDAAGEYLYVANYLSGSIAAYALDDDGRFGELVARCQHRGSGPSPRQTEPHAHCVLPGPHCRSVYAADLGADRVFRYELVQRRGEVGLEDREGLVLDPGSGPRHLVFHPNQPVAFLVCELQSTLVVLAHDPATGRLSRIGMHSTLPDDFVGDSTAAEVRVHPQGHRVFVSNRGHNSIAVFGFIGPDDPLELIGHDDCGGTTPRNFALHPSGQALLVANQDSHTIVPFAIDRHRGVPVQREAAYGVSEPVCLTYVRTLG